MGQRHEALAGREAGHGLSQLKSDELRTGSLRSLGNGAEPGEIHACEP